MIVMTTIRSAFDAVTAGFLRLCVAASFLSAVADRFGVWGPHGGARVAWGDWPHFVAYVATLNWFLPKTVIPALAILVTSLELLLGAALLAGIYTKTSAVISGALLSAFAVAMSMALGVKAPLDYSVFSAAAGCFLLGHVAAEDAVSRRLRAWLHSCAPAAQAAGQR